MSHNHRISYLGISMKASTYKVVQVIGIAVAVLGAILSYLFLKGYPHWLAGNAWWIFVCIAVGETVETVVALRKTRRGDAVAQDK